MITITDPRIEEYLMGLVPENDPHLLDMEKRAREMQFPIVDRLVGRLLYMLTRIRQPKLVVELGSGFGYSAYWFARAISISGKVVLIDSAEQNVSYARRLFEETGLTGRTELRHGDALRIGPEYEEIDILFIDIDKYQYPHAIEAMLPRLAPGSLVIADNALWHGRVVEPDGDKESEGIRRFNDFMFSRTDFFTTLLPLRDGVLLAYRLN
ncbi:O-methyltransferase [Geobacter sp. DSM 9736]|uniref:O-methyltransferase n=1 Tax=Geobacter sp. DSM 9736 TaxID=1277350 RepID=UPI000B51497B|nr:O-methyltransferase [Geobacter sp. DSM 9736]SNB46753.1 Predicted O-methyltransferase YrrM [Geobacter sp. DSM 9736]